MFGVSGRKAIPDVEGEVELSWATLAPKTAGEDSDFQVAGGLEEEQADKTDEIVEEQSNFGRANAGNQDDMDYEGGDWGIS